MLPTHAILSRGLSSWLLGLGLVLAPAAFAQAPVFVRGFGGPEPANGWLTTVSGIAVDLQGFVYVTDHYRHRVVKFTSQGTVFSTWGQEGHDPGMFYYPESITLAPDGHLYVADYFNFRIQKLTRDGSFVAQWKVPSTPWGIAVDEAQRMYITGGPAFLGGPDAIQVRDPAGQLLTWWWAPGFCKGVAVGRAGDLYVGYDQHVTMHRIEHRTQSGGLLGTWGQFGSNAGEFRFPAGIAIDSRNRVYVADAYNARVQVFTESGSFLWSFGTAGTAPGQFGQPRDVAIDSQDNVYVLDTGLARVQVFAYGVTPTVPTSWGRLKTLFR